MQRYGRYARAIGGLNGNPISNCWPVLFLNFIVLFVLLFFVVLFFPLLRLSRAATEEKKNATPFIFLIFSSHSSLVWQMFNHRSSQDIPSCLLYDNLADKSEQVPWTAGKTLLSRALRIP